MAKQKKSNNTINSTHRRDFSVFARKYLIILIPILTVIIVIAIICTFIFSPEYQVKSSLDTLARNYYENVFYQNMLSSKNYSGDPAKSLEKYTENGLTLVKLRQLILLNKDKTLDVDHVLEYCDKEQTLVKYYPEPPYEKTSYRIEFDYSCNF